MEQKTDLRNLIEDKDWPEFVLFLQTGAASDAFLSRLRSDEALQNAMEAAFEAQTSAFNDFLSLRSIESEPSAGLETANLRPLFDLPRKQHRNYFWATSIAAVLVLGLVGSWAIVNDAWRINQSHVDLVMETKKLEDARRQLASATDANSMLRNDVKQRETRIADLLTTGNGAVEQKEAENASLRTQLASMKEGNERIAADLGDTKEKLKKAEDAYALLTKDHLVAVSDATALIDFQQCVQIAHGTNSRAWAKPLLAAYSESSKTPAVVMLCNWVGDESTVGGPHEWANYNVWRGFPKIQRGKDFSKEDVNELLAFLVDVEKQLPLSDESGGKGRDLPELLLKRAVAQELVQSRYLEIRRSLIELVLDVHESERARAAAAFALAIGGSRAGFESLEALKKVYDEAHDSKLAYLEAASKAAMAKIDDR